MLKIEFLEPISRLGQALEAAHVLHCRGGLGATLDEVAQSLSVEPSRAEHALGILVDREIAETRNGKWAIIAMLEFPPDWPTCRGCRAPARPGKGTLKPVQYC